MNNTEMVIDLGNNERISRGIVKMNDTFIAVTFSQSKTFKTYNGAVKWLSKKLSV